MKAIIVVCIGLVFGLGNQVNAQQKPLKIGAETLIPFEYVENGEQTGINIQLIDTIFKRLNIPYEIHFGTENERSLDLIKAGKLDAILSISYKQDRLDYLWYPEGFENEDKPQNFMWASEYVFFSLKDRASLYKNLSLKEVKEKGLKVGVIDGVSYSPEFWNAGLTVVKGSSDEDNYHKLINGEIDLYITDKTIGRFTIKSMGYEDRVSYLPHRIISKPYTIAFNKKSTYPNLQSIEKQFFIELELAKKSGLARKIFLKYLRD
ncbi:transporter substrate-binding domain-containing protein [bacterium]|nr:MAG: transporter substrate-binding domain-containing protein [bacterium]